MQLPSFAFFARFQDKGSFVSFVHQSKTCSILRKVIEITRSRTETLFGIVLHSFFSNSHLSCCKGHLEKPHHPQVSSFLSPRGWFTRSPWSTHVFPFFGNPQTSRGRERCGPAMQSDMSWIALWPWSTEFLSPGIPALGHLVKRLDHALLDMHQNMDGRPFLIQP